MALQMDIPPGENRSSTFFLGSLGKPGVDAACLSLMVYLENGFEWPRSGAGTKMGWGIWGGDNASRVSGGWYPNQQTGFSARNVNNDNGFRLYSYHLNRSGKHGQQGSPVARFRSSDWGTGRWHQIEMEMVLNTPGKSDGYIQVWLDGKNRRTMTNLRFRDSSNWGIRGLMFNDMWGGNTSDPKQFSPKAQKMWYADYKLYTSSGNSVARSPTPSPDVSTPSSAPVSQPTSTAPAPTSDGAFGPVSPNGSGTDGRNLALQWRPDSTADKYYVRVMTRAERWADRKDIYGGSVWPNRNCNSSRCSLSVGTLPRGEYEWFVRPQYGSTNGSYKSMTFNVQ